VSATDPSLPAQATRSPHNNKAEGALIIDSSPKRCADALTVLS
jgi:hypothetical protein